MINFFRKIRRKLADDNKPLKYARYAVGEIVLVVIGILIALSINNWNENKKEQINDIKFLNNLRYEIELDTLMIAERVIGFNRINEKLKQTLQFLKKPTGVNEKERQIMSMAINTLPILTPIYKNIEKNNIKLANGVLFNIDNELNIKYQQYIEKTKSNNDIISKLGESLQFDFLLDVNPIVDLDIIDLSNPNIYFEIEELRNNRLFKNAINRSIHHRNRSIEFMNYQKELAIELLEILYEKLE
jgi:hypothetical protein